MYFEEHQTNGLYPEVAQYLDEWGDGTFARYRYFEHPPHLGTGDPQRQSGQLPRLCGFYANEWMRHGVGIYYDNTYPNGRSQPEHFRDRESPGLEHLGAPRILQAGLETQPRIDAQWCLAAAAAHRRPRDQLPGLAVHHVVGRDAGCRGPASGSLRKSPHAENAEGGRRSGVRRPARARQGTAGDAAALSARLSAGHGMWPHGRA